MRSALEIANWFISERDVTHLKLQKLLYIAFGLHYVNQREALFYDQFEAWKYGPVLQNIYLHLKRHGRNRLTETIKVFDAVPMVSDVKAIETLQLTWEHFGSKTASELVAWTHADGGPWDVAFDGREEQNLRPIGAAEIAKWFAVYWKDLQPTPKSLRKTARE